MARMWSLVTLFVGVFILLPSSYEASQEETLAANCRELQDAGNKESRMYLIKPEYSLRPFLVFCDMQTEGGGWVVVLDRADGRQDFNLPWNEYKVGFGNATGYWLGLEYLYQLTTDEPNELLMELTTFSDLKFFMRYKKFSIGSEDEAYRLKLIDGFSGNLNDAFSFSLGQKFSTVDRNNEIFVRKDTCVDRTGGGGWWYNNCFLVLLTGEYFGNSINMDSHYMKWIIDPVTNTYIALKEARMMVRPTRDYGKNYLQEDKTEEKKKVHGVKTSKHKIRINEHHFGNVSSTAVHPDDRVNYTTTVRPDHKTDYTTPVTTHEENSTNTVPSLSEVDVTNTDGPNDAITAESIVGQTR